MEEKLYTVKEASELLGLKEHSIRVYIVEGRLKAQKVFTSLVIPESEIERYKKIQEDWRNR